MRVGRLNILIYLIINHRFHTSSSANNLWEGHLLVRFFMGVVSFVRVGSRGNGIPIFCCFVSRIFVLMIISMVTLPIIERRRRSFAVMPFTILSFILILA